MELATRAETEARSSDGVVVTPAGLAGFMRGYAATIGDGTATNIAVTHNLGTKDVTVSVRDTATDTGVLVEWQATDVNTVTLKFASAPAAVAYRVVIAGL